MHYCTMPKINVTLYCTFNGEYYSIWLHFSVNQNSFLPHTFLISCHLIFMLFCWLNNVIIKCYEKPFLCVPISKIFTNVWVFNLDIMCFLKKIIFYNKECITWMRIRLITNRTPSCLINWKSSLLLET